MFIFITYEEQTYLERFNAIPVTTIESWVNQEIVPYAACCWSHPLLVAEFQYLHKKNTYWQDYVRHEWHMRSKYGLAITHQCMTMFDVRNNFCAAGFVRLTNFWTHIEVPRGCYTELPLVFTHKAEN